MLIENPGFYGCADGACPKRAGAYGSSRNVRADANAVRKTPLRVGADDVRRECADAHEA